MAKTRRIIDDLPTCVVSDEWLVLTLAKEGKALAFESIVDKYDLPVRNWVLTFLGHTPGVEDVCQEVWATVLEKLGNLSNLLAFKSWLWKIARNECYGQQRNQRFENHKTRSLPSDLAAREDQGNEEKVVRLRELIARLPENQKTVVLCYYHKGMAKRDIARYTGLTEGSVETLLSRARGAIRREWWASGSDAGR
jgi:RNA polymerase sigma-70 factor, ECF subfamily